MVQQVRRILVLATLAAALGLGSCKRESGDEARAAPKAVASAEARFSLATDMEDPPGFFGVEIDQDGPMDATLEVKWNAAERAVRYVVTVAAGDSCSGTPERPAESYDVKTTSVELPPLAPGSYAICVSAYNREGDEREAEGGDQLATIAEAPGR